MRHTKKIRDLAEKAGRDDFLKKSLNCDPKRHNAQQESCWALWYESAYYQLYYAESSAPEFN